MDQVRSFVVLADELHFTRAAHRLHLSQPGLSRRLDMLEREVGTKLMIRSNRRVELTPAGSVLLPHAMALLRAADTADLAVKSHVEGSRDDEGAALPQ